MSRIFAMLMERQQERQGQIQERKFEIIKKRRKRLSKYSICKMSFVVMHPTLDGALHTPSDGWWTERERIKQRERKRERESEIRKNTPETDMNSK